MKNAFYIPQLDTNEGRILVENLLEATVDAALLLDRDLHVLYLTEGFEELTGQKQAEYMGHAVSELKIGDVSPIQEVLSTGRKQNGVTMHIGGQYLMTNIVPVIWEAEVTGVVVMVLFRSMAVLKRAIAEQERRFAATRTMPQQKGIYSFADYIGEAPEILTMLEQCHRVAHSTHPVLLIGETGVGKEILAGGIYQEYAAGRNLPYIRINCSAIPRDLLESELFGHEKGAFTGASTPQKGKFELASGGVLLLDEIGEMDVSLQSKLLRVLEEREFERIGGSRVIPLNAKIIVSTNENLKQMAANKQFRMDLYYRINTFEINIPPLRAHKQDIPELIRHFSAQDGLSLDFDEDAMNMLLHYDWPGNVRELRNVLNRLHFLYPNTIINRYHVYDATGEMFHLVQLPDYHGIGYMPPPTETPQRYDDKGNRVSEPQEQFGTTDAAALSGQNSTSVAVSQTGSTISTPSSTGSLKDAERELITVALEECRYNCTAAARKLGISRSTLYEKIRKYELSGLLRSSKA